MFVGDCHLSRVLGGEGLDMLCCVVSAYRYVDLYHIGGGSYAGRYERGGVVPKIRR